MTNEAGLEFAKDNAMPTPMTIEMEADERQAALASLKREYELNGSNPCNWFIRDYYDVLRAALQLSLKNDIPEKQNSLSGANERQKALDTMPINYYVDERGFTMPTNIAGVFQWYSFNRETIRAALQSPRVEPLSKEECDKFASIKIRLNDDGSYGYLRSGSLPCEDIFKCISHHCGGLPRVPVIPGLDEALVETWGNFDDAILQAARAYAELQKEVAQPKYKRVDLGLKREMRNPIKQGGKSNDWYQNGYDVGYNAAIDDIKSKYGDLYVEVRE